MKQKIIKYRLLFIIAILILCSLFAELPYHSDYYKDSPILFYFLVTTFNLLVYLIPVQKFLVSEKILYSMLISIVVLLIAGFFVEKIMGLIYGYDSNWDELKSPKFLDSFLFCLTSTFSGIGLFSIWLRYKKPIYK